MDKELESLLREAHGLGASEADLDKIIESYGSKKKIPSQKPSLPSYSKPFQNVSTDSPTVLTKKGAQEFSYSEEQNPQPKKVDFKKFTKDMQDLSKAKLKDVKDFSHPELNTIWQEVKANPQPKDPIIEMYKASMDFAGDKMPTRVKNAWERGKMQGEIANLLPLNQAPTEEDLRGVAALSRMSEEIPQSEESKKFQEEGMGWLFSNPLQGAKFIGETIIESLSAQIKASERTTPLAVGIGAGAGSVIPGIGNIVGATTGLTAGQIAAGMNLETSGKMLEVLKDAGFDTKDGDSLIRAFQDPKLLDKARDLAIKRGLPIALIDLLTLGLSSKIAAKPAKTLIGKAGKATGALGAEAVGGSAGELTAQVASGEDVDLNSVLIEGIAEIGSGAPALASEYASIVTDRNKTSTSDANIIKQVANDKETGVTEAKANLDTQLEAGLITEEQHKEGVQFVEKVSEVDSKIPEGVVGESREKSVVLLTEKEQLNGEIQQLESQKEAIDEAYHAPINEQIKAKQEAINGVNTQLQELSNVETTTEESRSTETETTTELPSATNGVSEEANTTGVQENGSEVVGESVQEDPAFTETEQIQESEQQPADTNVGQSIEESNSQEDGYNSNNQIDPQLTEEPTIEGEVKTPTQEKLAEIQARREELWKKFKTMTATANSGFNPEAVVELAKIGATYIEEGVVRFKDFATKIKEDYGQEIPDAILRDVYKQSAEANGLGVRGFTESIADSKLTKETKKAVDSSDYKLYEKQSHEELSAQAEKKTDLDLEKAVAVLENLTGELKTEQNSFVTDAIELLNRYDRAGDTENANRIAEALSKNATVIAQTLAQYAQLNKGTKQGYLKLIEKFLASHGKELTETQKKRIEELYQVKNELQKKLDEAREVLLKKLDTESKLAYWQAQELHEKALRNLDNYIESLMPRELASVLVTIQKGNLLTFKSLLANPLYNIFYAPIRFFRGEIANLSDKAISKAFGVHRTKASSLSGIALSTAGQSLVRGWKTAVKTAFKGGINEDLSKLEIDRRLKPLEAWKRLLGKGDPEVSRKLSEKISDILEGTIGVPANIALRALPFGDAPFSEIATNQRLLEIGTNKGLKGDDLKRFMINPDKDSLDSAREYGRSATFQDDNMLATGAKWALKAAEKAATKLDPMFGGVIKVLLNSAFPFIKTPSSVALKILNYAVPIVPFTKMAFESKRFTKAVKSYKTNPSADNKATLEKVQRKLNEHNADFVISLALTGAASWIVANGLVTGSAPEDKERKKEKDFMYLTQPPFTINMSGFKRLVAGEDTAYRQGDLTMSYNVLGVFGAILGIVNDTNGSELKDKLRKGEKVDLEGNPYYKDRSAMREILDDYIFGAFDNASASVKYLTDQSFLQGVEAIMTTIGKGDYGNIGQQLFRTMLSIPVPNTFVQVNKAWRESLKNPYSDDQLETFWNIAKERTGIDAKSLPNRVNMWGEDIKQTPEGASFGSVVYQAFDPFRFQTILNDELTFKVFDIQRKTKSNDAIPPVIQGEIIFKGERRKLNKEQMAELQRLVGVARKREANKKLLNYNPSESNPEKFLEKLQEAYEEGSKKGKKAFISKYKTELANGKK